jgi:hypothetical protein
MYIRIVVPISKKFGMTIEDLPGMFQKLENYFQNVEGRQKGVFLIARKTFVEAY